jgi:hypothetical protein
MKLKVFANLCFGYEFDILTTIAQVQKTVTARFIVLALQATLYRSNVFAARDQSGHIPSLPFDCSGRL